MAAGKLNVPRMYLQFVFVCPQPLDANAQISQPEALAGIGPRVMLTVLLTVVNGPAKPFINVPAGTDQL
jgi:hypothetical protein